MTGSVCLRPFREDDLAMLERFAVDPAFSAPFQWSGYRWPGEYRARWEKGGFLDEDPRMLVVAEGTDDGPALGWVAWRDPHFANRAGVQWEIGIILMPEHRGRGVGTEAQRVLAAHLFDTTSVHRLCANTEADNVAEQRALEAAGFRREGVLRQAGFRGGRWRDAVVYGRLRDDDAAE